MRNLRSKIGFQTAFILVAMSLLLFLANGCQPDPLEPDAAEEEVAAEILVPDPLTVLIIDAPEVGSQIKRQWRARRDGELTVIDRTSSDWSEQNYSIEADVVLYPSALLADLVTRDCLLAVPEATWKSDEIARRDILKRSRQSTIEYDDSIWAVPLANPQWMLLYRADLLEQVNVDVPQTWAQWSDAVEKIRSVDLADLPSLSEDRVVLPLGNNWAAHAFLLRCATSIRQRGKLSTVFDRSNMSPLIDRPPFVEALSDLKKQFAGQSMSLTPADGWQRLLTGKTVMTIGWPMNLESQEELADSSHVDSIAIAAVPGSDRWYDLQAGKWFTRDSEDEQRVVDYFGFGGIVGSVSADSRHASTAFDFLQWLGSSSISASLLSGSQQSGPVRKSHLRSAARWAGSQLSPVAAESMAGLVRSSHTGSVSLIFPRVPGYHDYIQSLDRHVRKCLEENVSPEDALQSAAKEWDAITDEIGRTEQTANLRRVNGL